VRFCFAAPAAIFWKPSLVAHRREHFNFFLVNVFVVVLPQRRDLMHKNLFDSCQLVSSQSHAHALWRVFSNKGKRRVTWIMSIHNSEPTIANLILRIRITGCMCTRQSPYEIVGDCGDKGSQWYQRWIVLSRESYWLAGVWCLCYVWWCTMFLIHCSGIELVLCNLYLTRFDLKQSY